MPDDNPCRYCKPPKRQSGCQDWCEDGIEWLRKKHAQDKRVNAAHKLDQDLDNILKGKHRGNWR